MNTKEQKEFLRLSVFNQISAMTFMSLSEVVVTLPKLDGMTDLSIRALFNEWGYPDEQIAYIGSTQVLVEGKQYNAVVIGLSLK